MNSLNATQNILSYNKCNHSYSDYLSLSLVYPRTTNIGVWLVLGSPSEGAAPRQRRDVDQLLAHREVQAPEQDAGGQGRDVGQLPAARAVTGAIGCADRPREACVG